MNNNGEKYNNWQELENNVKQIMEKPPQPDTTLPALLAIQLWFRSTYDDPYVTWNVFADPHPLRKNDATAIVRQVTWDSREQKTHFEELEKAGQALTSQPLLVIKDAHFKQIEFNRRVEQAYSLRFPLIGVAPKLGHDGATYGIRIPSYFAGASMNWWSLFPEEWRPLVEWAREMREFLTETLKAT